MAWVYFMSLVLRFTNDVRVTSSRKLRETANKPDINSETDHLVYHNRDYKMTSLFGEPGA
jgi:hypothetical protein